MSIHQDFVIEREVTLYQEFPTRLKLALVLNIFVVAYAAGGALVFRSNSLVFWIFSVGLILAAGACIFNVLQAVAMTQPMLVLQPKSLTYRKVSMPWNLIVEVGTLQLPSGPCVGLTLREGTLRLLPADNAVAGPTIGPLLRASIRKHGAIPVPCARGLTVEEMRDLILGYQRENAIM
jgi:hypothetical protein